MRKKILTFIILGTMLFGSTTAYANELDEPDVATSTDAHEDGIEVQASSEDINADDVFLKQQSSGRCTLTANVNMLRRNALIHGDPTWKDITEDTAAPYLWINGTGMKWDYKYGDTEVKRVSTSNMTGEEKVELFKNLLKLHPEGIVIHDYESKLGYPHAILLTDYTNGEFYCAEPANGYPGGRIPVSKSAVDVEGTDQYWYVSEPGQLDDGIVYANPSGIVVMKSDHTGYTAGIATSSQIDKSRIEYSWYASTDDGETYTCISDWTAGYEWIDWTPDSFGEYLIIGKTRVDGEDESEQEVWSDYVYNPAIKGKCQMPYTGEGGGYLIGIESYDNPNQEYTYELLVLDCTLLAEGKAAWIWTTGRCKVPETSFWAVWQPQYGYYWTLFRVYDKDGNLIDQECYPFVNAY